MSDGSPAAGRLRVLVADDQLDVQEALRLLLKGAGHQAETVGSPQAVLAAVDAKPYDLLLLDMNYSRDTTSGQEGLELLSRLQARGVPSPLVVMTAWGEVDLAVEAMRRGAADFVQKPWDNTRLLGTIEKQGRAARRARSELEIARSVQQKLLPQKAPVLRTLACAGTCLPAREVGGDYYDFLDLGDGHMGVVLADVSGKGVPAALLMAHLQALFRSHAAQARHEPAALLSMVNQLFHESTTAERYVTLFFGVYSDASRSLRYVNCGHCAPLLRRVDGTLERLDSTAGVLGLFPHWEGQVGSATLGPKDLLVLFSDGVTEGCDNSDAEFGEERLGMLLQAHAAEAPEVLRDRLVEAVRTYVDGGQVDDLTVVVLRGL